MFLSVFKELCHLHLQTFYSLSMFQRIIDCLIDHFGVFVNLSSGKDEAWISCGIGGLEFLDRCKIGIEVLMIKMHSDEG